MKIDMFSICHWYQRQASKSQHWIKFFQSSTEIKPFQAVFNWLTVARGVLQMFTHVTFIIPGCVRVAPTKQGHHGIHHAPLAEGSLDIDALLSHRRKLVYKT